MAKARRVFQIARELGVDSKTILEKCRAEGVDMNNHMSTVSAGLEATIREWFSEEEGQSAHTAVETTEKVDLNKARKKARPRRTKKADAESIDGETTAVAVEAAEASAEEEAAPPKADESAPDQTESPKVAKAKKATRKPKSTPKPKPEPETTVTADADAAVVQSVDEPDIQTDTTDANGAPSEVTATDTDTTSEEAPQPEATTTDESDPPAPASPVVVPNAPSRPDVVTPAGPQLEQPSAAKLKGPKVVRIEKPDPTLAPRARRSPGPSQPNDPVDPADVLRSTGPVRGKGAVRQSDGEEGGDNASRSPRRRGGGPAGNTRAGGASTRRSRPGEGEVWRRDTFSEQDLIEREERLSRAGGFLKQRRREMRRRDQAALLGPADRATSVEIQEPITIKDLSATAGIKAADIIKFLFNKGVMATINHTIDGDTAMEVGLEHDIEVVVREAQTAEDVVVAELEQRDPVDLRRRPPIVTILGHVDHGKTSLLDRIRSAHVVDGEDGGITQHIGAYRAAIPGSDGRDRTVVFLDTPGHEAFTSMRARGANLTDIVVLVVAADDGMMPQTIESINHAKAAGVPIVVALNKIDLPNATDANIQRILSQLAEHELNPVEWGGTTEVVRTSAETGEGVEGLIEMLDYQAELLELQADYGGAAHGQVIEAELHTGRGAVARIMVRGGEMKVGDFIVAGRAFGRVRDMIDDRGRNIETAGPATPLEISGIDSVPDAGDKFYVTDALKKAEEIAEQRRDQERKVELATSSKVTLDSVFGQIGADEAKELRVVIRADVQGSIEVLRKSMEEMSNDQVAIRVLHAAVGGITESDILLAEASEAVIIGFHVIASGSARNEAERRGVDIRLYRVIYDLTDDIHAAQEGLLSPEKREEVHGHAEVREVFRVSRVGAVAGCYVTDGVVRRNALVRITRDGIVIEEDRALETLKRFKDDAREVRAGMECGMSIAAYNDIHAGDVIECYETTEVAARLAGRAASREGT